VAVATKSFAPGEWMSSFHIHELQTGDQPVLIKRVGSGYGVPERL
jgi:hypothetical protein